MPGWPQPLFTYADTVVVPLTKFGTKALSAEIAVCDRIGRQAGVGDGAAADPMASTRVEGVALLVRVGLTAGAALHGPSVDTHLALIDGLTAELPPKLLPLAQHRVAVPARAAMMRVNGG